MITKFSNSLNLSPTSSPNLSPNLSPNTLGNIPPTIPLSASTYKLLHSDAKSSVAGRGGKWQSHLESFCASATWWKLWCFMVFTEVKGKYLNSVLYNSKICMAFIIFYWRMNRLKSYQEKGPYSPCTATFIETVS